MSRALRIRPGATDVLANLNGVLMALNRHREALANLDKKAGNNADAESHFRQAVSIYGKTVGGEHPENGLQGRSAR